MSLVYGEGRLPVMSKRPIRIAARPDVKADVLSDVLRAVRLKGAVYFDHHFSSPWVAEAPPSREIAGRCCPAYSALSSTT
jgi:hypothetical protein